jgi:L-ascorbate metabolism protein UlaG (beta-lactamase superfamily)
MIEPLLSDDRFLADVESTRGGPGIHLWWLGQSGFLLGDGRHYALIDPYLSDSLTRKYAGTEKPHVRMTRRVVDPARLGFVSTVTSSHNHTDHLDAETLLPILAANPNLTIVVPEANLQFATDRLGLAPERLRTANASAVLLHDKEWYCVPVPAAHDRLERDEAGRHKYLGYVFGIGPHLIYHSGDTVVYEGLADALRNAGPWETGVTAAILPINGKVGNMGGRDAARLAKAIGAWTVIPCHYEMFEFNTADPRDEFIPECERLGQPYKVLRAGERWSSQ